MARTIRRTRGDQHQLTTFVAIETASGGLIFEYRRLTPRDPEYRKAYWDYHKDGPSGVYGVPRWYRHMLDRSKATKEKQALTRALKTPDLELVDLPRKKDAGYTWW